MYNKKLIKFLAFVIVTVAASLSVFARLGVSGDEYFQPEKPMTKQERLEKTIYLQNLNYAAACDGVLKVINENDRTITPVYIEEKFYIPLRFVLEYYGVTVSWEHETKTVVMNAGEKEYRISTKDAVMSYGKKTKQLSNPCVINRGTTLVAFDDISEIIGCNTYYYESYKSGVIAIGTEWDAERDAEKQALSAMEFAVSPFFKMFI